MGCRFGIRRRAIRRVCLYKTDSGLRHGKANEFALLICLAPEFQNTAFLRCEIEVVGVVECVQDIKVVAQFPIAGVGGGLCGKVRRVNEEAHAVLVLILAEKAAVVLVYDRQAVKVAVGSVVRLAQGVVEGVFLQFCE